MSYEFGGTLFSNFNDAELASVKTFLYAGSNAIDVETLFNNLDQIAQEMVDQWPNVDGSTFDLYEAKMKIRQALNEIVEENA